MLRLKHTGVRVRLSPFAEASGTNAATIPLQNLSARAVRVRVRTSDKDCAEERQEGRQHLLRKDWGARTCRAAPKASKVCVCLG